MEKIKSKIEDLIKKYEYIKASGKIKHYNEANTRKDFIVPLFSQNLGTHPIFLIPLSSFSVFLIISTYLAILGINKFYIIIIFMSKNKGCVPNLKMTWNDKEHINLYYANDRNIL